MPRNTRFISDDQAIKAAVLGLPVDSELLVLNPNLEGERLVYDLTKEQRKACIIRIQNVGTQPVFWSENLGQCTAAQYNGVLAKDSVGGAAPEGDGGGIEFRAHIPKNIYVFATAAAAVRVTKRYV